MQNAAAVYTAAAFFNAKRDVDKSFLSISVFVPRGTL
jgi:hypothetical protein